MTAAVFRFKDCDAVGSLNHTLLLHESEYFTELDLCGDGFHIIISDPYQNPSVMLRRPGSNDYEKVHFQLSKISAILNAGVGPHRRAHEVTVK